MNKSDFWNSIWIPNKKRPPPVSDDMILVWNPLHKCAYSIESYIANQAIEVIENGGSITKDRVFTHWCQPYGPEK